MRGSWAKFAILLDGVGVETGELGRLAILRHRKKLPNVLNTMHSDSIKKESSESPRHSEPLHIGQRQ